MTTEQILGFEVGLDEASHRFDVAVARRLEGGSRTVAAALIKSGRVTADGVPVDKPSARLRGDEVVVVRLPPPEPSPLEPEEIPIVVLHEDDWLLVIDKPAGMVVHPARGHHSGTLVNALLGRPLAPAPQDDPFKPGIVHRLDKDTSGCLVVAKTAAARAHLEGEFRDRRVGKRYQAIVHGTPPSRGSVDAPVGRDPKNRKRMCVRGEGGREALSRYRVLERFAEASLVEVEIATGRTHQIRVHLTSLGHPVVGDSLYGGSSRGRLGPLRRFDRQALHAAELRFIHPETGREVAFFSKLPMDMQSLLDELRSGSRTSD